MIDPRPRPSIERAQALLGTAVRIRVSGLVADHAHAAIDLGFAAIAEIQQLMSFHGAGSDLSRLNREASRGPVAVDPHTYNVICLAQQMAAATEGLFDITVARELVEWGFLPRPEAVPEPDPGASWRDIETLDQGRIRFHRPLWIDLGGIAKGYAVDVALARMGLAATLQCRINAGGDLRVAGPETDRALLRVPGHSTENLPVVEITNGSLASSCGHDHARPYLGQWVAPHVHGLRRNAAGKGNFASVVAPRCAVADALTKVVLAGGAEVSAILREFAATAYLHSAEHGWQTLGELN